MSQYRLMPASLQQRRSSASCATVNLVLSVAMFSASHSVCRRRCLSLAVSTASTAAACAYVLHSVFNPLPLSVPFIVLYCRFYRKLVAFATAFPRFFPQGARPRFFVMLQSAKCRSALEPQRFAVPRFSVLAGAGWGEHPAIRLGFPPPL